MQTKKKKMTTTRSVVLYIPSLFMILLPTKRQVTVWKLHGLWSLYVIIAWPFKWSVRMNCFFLFLFLYYAIKLDILHMKDDDFYTLYVNGFLLFNILAKYIVFFRIEIHIHFKRDLYNGSFSQLKSL